MSSAAVDLGFDQAVQLVPFLRALSGQQLERLRSYAKLRRVRRGQGVWRVGDPTTEFTFLCQGRAKLVKAGEAEARRRRLAAPWLPGRPRRPGADRPRRRLIRRRPSPVPPGLDGPEHDICHGPRAALPAEYRAFPSPHPREEAE